MRRLVLGVLSDEHAPRRVSEFHLAIDEPPNCAQEFADGTNASVHSKDLDVRQPTQTALYCTLNALTASRR